MQHRIHHALDEKLVDLGTLTREIELHPLAAVAGEIADDERHPPEDLANRNQPHAHHAFAKIAQVPLDARAVVLEGTPFLERHVRFNAVQRVLEPGPRHDHVADQSHEVVEPGQVHAHDVGGPREGDVPHRSFRHGGCDGDVHWCRVGQELVAQPVVTPLLQLRVVVGLHIELERNAAGGKDLRRDVQHLANLQETRTNRVDLHATLDELR